MLCRNTATADITRRIYPIRTGRDSCRTASKPQHSPGAQLMRWIQDPKVLGARVSARYAMLHLQFHSEPSEKKKMRGYSANPVSHTCVSMDEGTHQPILRVNHHLPSSSFMPRCKFSYSIRRLFFWYINSKLVSKVGTLTSGREERTARCPENRHTNEKIAINYVSLLERYFR